jgi:flagellar biosynthesis protein
MSVHNSQNPGNEENLAADESEGMDFIAIDQMDFTKGFQEDQPGTEQPLKEQYAFGLDIDPVTGLPRITAMGRGRIAQQILKKAAEAGVQIEHDPETVGKMFRPTTDQVIPTRTYQVIAEILTFIYQLNEAYNTEKAAAHLRKKTEKITIKGKKPETETEDEDETFDKDSDDMFEESDDDTETGDEPDEEYDEEYDENQ